MAEVNEVVRDAMKEVAKEAYDDFVHPVAKPTGELGSFLPRAIKAALAPLEKWILQKEYTMAEVKKSLEEKLKDVPPESITPPEPYIAVPALQYMSYCMDNEELREMYANLLANSMNKVVKDGVHPGFVEIIKQLCPDEAKILKYISIYGTIPVITLRGKTESGGIVELIKNFSNIGEITACEMPFEIHRYFDNLFRLGLIDKNEPGMLLKDEAQYTPLINNSYITSVAEMEINSQSTCVETEIDKGYVSLTSFGTAFCVVCLPHRKRNISNQEESEEEGLNYACTLIENISRKTKNIRREVVVALGWEKIEEIYKHAEIYNRRDMDEVSDEFIRKLNLQEGNFDNITTCKYSVPSRWPIGDVYAQLSRRVSIERKLYIIDALMAVYQSPISEKIDDYNNNFYYKDPDYIFDCFINLDYTGKVGGGNDVGNI